MIRKRLDKMSWDDTVTYLAKCDNIMSKILTEGMTEKEIINNIEYINIDYLLKYFKLSEETRNYLKLIKLGET